MSKKLLHKLPAWLVLSPWLAVGCAVILTGCVLLYDMINSKREKDFATQITLEKGQALINTLESALQLGIGQKWSHQELEILLESISRQEDILILALIDSGGLIMFSGKPSLIASRPFSDEEIKTLNPSESYQWRISGWNNQNTFFVYKKFDPELGHGSHGHEFKNINEAEHSPALLSDASDLNIFVGYDLSQIEKAELTDKSHTVITASILTFLALVGGLTCFLVRGYQRSRKVVLETTAFSSEVLSTLPVGIIATDMDDRVTTINPEALKIIGLGKDDAIGASISDILPSLWPILAENLGNGKPIREMETRCHFQDGHYVPLGVGLSRIITEDGRPVGNVIILRDLGEIRDLQAELRLRDRLAAIGTLAAGVAHEIKNPLSAIRGFAKYFMESAQNDQTDAKMAMTLEQEVMRLDKVVGDLLDYARPDNLFFSSFPLQDLIDRAQQMVQEQLDSQGIEFKSDLPLPPLSLTGDEDKLTQVFINLFLNAIQAMQKCSTKILTVTGRIVKQSRHTAPTLLLEVCDTGPGIPAEIINDVFSPYFTTKASGTGLGLPIVHKIIEAHEGHIDLKSSPGQGVSFIISLPLDGPNIEEK